MAVMLMLVAAALGACSSGSEGPAAGTESGSTRCPKWPPQLSGGTSPGDEGETVPDGPSSALICRWRGVGAVRTERDHKFVRGPALAGLVATLNSLSPGLEGEFACPSGTPLSYVVALNFAGGDDALVEAEYHSCDIVRTADHYWEASEALRAEMDLPLGDQGSVTPVQSQPPT